MKRTKVVRGPIKRTKVARRRPMKEEDQFDIKIKEFGRHPYETFGDVVFHGRINGVNCSGSYYNGGNLWRISLGSTMSLENSTILCRVLEAYMLKEYGKETREVLDEMAAEWKVKQRNEAIKHGLPVRTPVKR